MKKIIFMAMAALAVMTASAQNEVGRFSVQPKVGVSMNNVAGMEDLKSKGVKYANKGLTAGALIGAEFEYQASRLVGLAAGINYSMQGCRWESFNSTGNGVNKHIENPALRLGYINVPVVANFYVYKGLALKVGMQMGFLTNAHVCYQYDQTVNGRTVTNYGSINVNDDCHTFDFSFPVGVSYEFGNHIVLDARYNIGTTYVVKRGNIETGATANSSLLLTVGYKFGL